MALLTWSVSSPAEDSKEIISGMAGAGLFLGNSCLGCGNTQVFPVPLVDLKWQDMVFLNTSEGLSFNLLNRPDFEVGPFLNYVQARTPGDFRNSKRKSLPGIPADLAWGVYLDASTGPVETILWVNGYGRHGGGLSAEWLVRGYFMPTPHLIMSFSPTLTWGNFSYNQKFFAVSEQESAATGLSVYSPWAGLRDVGLEMRAIGNFQNPKWYWQISAERRWLVGPASLSPIPEVKKMDRVILGITYRL